MFFCVWSAWFSFVIMPVKPQYCNVQPCYTHLFFQDKLGYQNMYAAVMSHECIKSYKSINTNEK